MLEWYIINSASWNVSYYGINEYNTQMNISEVFYQT